MTRYLTASDMDRCNFRALWICLFLLGCVTPIASASLVLPDLGLASPSPNAFPFGANEDFRYQQVYDQSAFPGPVRIDAIAFFPKSDIDYRVDVRIRMGLTDKAVNDLSTDLDANVFGALTTVFDDPNYSRSLVANTPSLAFDFTSPFFFDPTAGKNLLIQIRLRNQVDAALWGNTLVSNSGVVSRAYRRSGFGKSADSAGLVTRFAVSPIPEPSTLAIWSLLGLVGAGVQRRRRNRAA